MFDLAAQHLRQHGTDQFVTHRPIQHGLHRGLYFAEAGEHRIARRQAMPFGIYGQGNDGLAEVAAGPVNLDAPDRQRRRLAGKALEPTHNRTFACGEVVTAAEHVADKRVLQPQQAQVVVLLRRVPVRGEQVRRAATPGKRCV